MGVKDQSTVTSKLWSVLLHLGYNMWSDRPQVMPGKHGEYIGARPYLRFDDKLWDDLLKGAADAGLNSIVLDLGEGVKYQSHPEIAVENAWSCKRLRTVVAEARSLGIEMIPKLNFSTAHDAWMAEYSRMVSTPRYYEVCRDLISEVIELFDGPRLFHLGMDEETAAHQEQYDYVVVRQHDLWWNDLLFLVGEVEKGSSRAWVWSDYVWHHPDLFYARMPRSVVQSNWYYEECFDLKERPETPLPYDYSDAYLAYLDLDEHGYDQIPTGSNWSFPTNMGKTVEFCEGRIAPQRLLGYLQTPWAPTLEPEREHHFAAIEQLGSVKKSRECKTAVFGC